MLEDLTHYELIEYVEHLEERIRKFEKAADNSPKLSAEEVQELRSLYHDLGWTVTDLAEEFSVNRSTVYRTLRGEYHRDVE